MPLSRPLRAAFSAIALAMLGLLASTASAASFSYDAGTRVLRLTGATGEVVHVQSSAIAPASGEYLIDATVGGVTVPWTGTGRAGLLPFSVPGSPATHGLTVQADVVGGLPLERIDVVDDTGPVEVLVMGGAVPYADPVAVTLNNASSVAKVKDLSGDPISFGTTSLSINAPDVRLIDNIVGAGTITLTSGNPIKLMKPNPGIGLPTLSLTANTQISTTSVVGNATGTANVLEVHGPWRTNSVTNTAEIRAFGTTRLLGDLTATSAVQLGALEVGGFGVRRTVTSPNISVGTVTGGFSACGGPGVIGMCDINAQSPPGGGEVTFAGAVSATGGWADMGVVEVTGVTRLAGDIAMPTGTVTFTGGLHLSGAATRRITAGVLQTPSGLGQDLNPCGAGVINSCAGAAPQSLPLPTTDLVVDALWVNGLTAYMPGSITALQPVLTPSTGIMTSTIQSGGTVDLRDGVSIGPTASLTLSGAPTVLAGVKPTFAVGSIGATVAPGPCTPGPLLVIGNWRLTAPIECLSTLTTADGTATLGADVTTDAHQAYGGPVVLALGGGPRTLRAGGGSLVAFNGGPVSATWNAASGEVASYTASIAPTGQACTTPDASTTCSFGTIDPAPQFTASVAVNAPGTTLTPSTGSGTGAAERALPSGTTTRRQVKRGSKTPLTRLIIPPASRGKRTWAEKGPCAIRDGRLVAPKRPGACTVTLRVAKYRRMPAWTGRATVIVQ